MLLSERVYDRALRIRTTGLREWQGESAGYHRYEPTSYRALDLLFKHYHPKETDRVVDFGSGLGRVAFYIHNRWRIPVTGVEANAITYRDAIDNLARYEQRAKHIPAPIRFQLGLAEHYQIEPEDNIFYFFNPFSGTTFSQVVGNILDSVYQVARPVDIILYYPMPKYIKFLQRGSPFELVSEVKIPKMDDPDERFLIYRCDIEEALRSRGGYINEESSVLGDDGGSRR